MNEHILLAYDFDGKGGGQPLTGDEVSKHIKDDKLAWAHLDSNHPDTKIWLEKEISYLDPFIVEALIADETRPRMTQIDEGVLLILRGVNLNKDSRPEDMVSIRLWVDEHRIISVTKRKLNAVLDIESKLKSFKGPNDAGDFICMLIFLLFERMEPVLTDLDDSTDDVEETILKLPNSTMREAIINIRKQAIMFRRYMSPQKDAIGHLMISDLTWISDTNRRDLQESYNHVTRYVENLDAIRERSQIVKDELANILSDRLNKNLYVLSVITSIFLPLSFLTGLLGINIGGIPGSDNPAAFFIFCAILLVLGIIQIILLRKLKWFE